MPLSKLLADLRVTQINFFSLDVEGAELSVLQVCRPVMLSSSCLAGPNADLDPDTNPKVSPRRHAGPDPHPRLTRAAHGFCLHRFPSRCSACTLVCESMCNGKLQRATLLVRLVCRRSTSGGCSSMSS